MNANNEEEIKIYLNDIDKLGFEKKLTLNSKELSLLIGVSASSIESYRKQGIGPEYSIVGGRVFYIKRKVAEWLSLTSHRTA